MLTTTAGDDNPGESAGGPKIQNSKQEKKISPTHRQSDQPAQDCVKVENLINTDEEKVDQEKTVPPVIETNEAPVTTSKTEPITAKGTINLEDSAKEVTNVNATVPETTLSAEIISATTTTTILTYYLHKAQENNLHWHFFQKC